MTKGQQKRYEELHAEWKKYEAQKQALLTGEIAAFNEVSLSGDNGNKCCLVTGQRSISRSLASMLIINFN